MLVIPTHTVVTHYGCQVDEGFSWWMAYRLGEKYFPGIRTAKTMLVNAGPFTPDGRPASAWEAEGHLILGVWGSRFDEHVLPLERQNAGECTATLMATHLSLEGDDALSQLLKFVSDNDSAGHSTPFDLAAITKDLHNYFEFQGRMAAEHGKSFPADSQVRRVRDILFTIFDAKYSAQKEFMKAIHNSTNPAFVSHQSVDCRDGQERLVAVITSSNRQASRAMRSLRPRPDIIIQRNHKGQVTIFGAGSMPLGGVASRIMGYEKERSKLTELQVQRRWMYFHRNNANMLINGGLSAPNVPPTQLSLELIKRVVIEELQQYRRQS